jgi:hypothetical protein
MYLVSPERRLNIKEAGQIKSLKITVQGDDYFEKAFQTLP